MWEMQKRMFNELLEAKKAGIGAGQTLLMVEHPHVYTLGKSGHESNMLVSDEFLRSIGASYFHTDRGGDITYHGYGQLVGEEQRHHPHRNRRNHHAYRFLRGLAEGMGGIPSGQRRMGGRDDRRGCQGGIPARDDLSHRRAQYGLCAVFHRQ